MKSEAVYTGWSEPLESRATRSSHGSKKAAVLPPLSETVIPLDTTNPASTILELDERWSFVAKKGCHKHKAYFVSCLEVEWVQGHLETGQGLARAVADVDIIVHAASDPLHSRHIDVNDGCLPYCNYGGNFYVS